MDQRDFLKGHVEDHIRCNMVYLKPSPTWAGAPLLVSKPGPALLLLTVYHRSVNQYNTVAQYPMRNLEQELKKAWKSLLCRF